MAPAPRVTLVNKSLALYFVALLLLLGACQRADAPSAGSGTPIATQNAAAPPDNTPTPTATATPLPVRTLPPPATIAIAPTVTPAPATDTPAASTVAPTATPAPLRYETTDDLVAAGRNPFTGEPLAEERRDNRPILCKISNSPKEWVRPQSGLNAADIVYEHLSEGTITRFTALFYGNVPDKIGPVRSARLIDLELPAMYDAALCYSGASIGVSNRIVSSDFRPRVLWSWFDGYYRTGEDKPWEHTLYATLEPFWTALAESDENRAPSLNTQMVFDTAPPADGMPATSISIDYRRDFVEWVWDAEINRYRRFESGDPIVDANDGEQVTAANVIIAFASHQENRTICETQRNDRCEAWSVEIQLWSQGFLTLFRDGQRYEGAWRRDNRGDMLTFFDMDGNPLPLQIGNSWVQVVPYYLNDPVQFAGP